MTHSIAQLIDLNKEENILLSVNILPKDLSAVVANLPHSLEHFAYSFHAEERCWYNGNSYEENRAHNHTDATVILEMNFPKKTGSVIWSHLKANTLGNTTAGVSNTLAANTLIHTFHENHITRYIVNVPKIINVLTKLRLIHK
jgi:hypothetical protein